MVRMRTRIPHCYGHRKVPAQVGEEFDCEPGHVRAMLTYADVVEQQSGYLTRAMVAESTVERALGRKKKKAKR